MTEPEPRLPRMTDDEVGLIPPAIFNAVMDAWEQARDDSPLRRPPAG